MDQDIAAALNDFRVINRSEFRWASFYCQSAPFRFIRVEFGIKYEYMKSESFKEEKIGSFTYRIDPKTNLVVRTKHNHL